MCRCGSLCFSLPDGRAGNSYAPTGNVDPPKTVQHPYSGGGRPESGATCLPSSARPRHSFIGWQTVYSRRDDEGGGPMEPASAELLDGAATVFAATAVFGVLFAAVIGSSERKGAQVPPGAVRLALLGVIIFLGGRAIRYHFAGY